VTPLELAPLQVLAWLVTYLAHSTLLLCLAWVLTRRRVGLSLASRERLWKLAVVGGFLTAALQVGLGWEPPLGRLHLRGATPPVAEAPTPDVAPGHAPAPAAAAARPERVDRTAPAEPASLFPVPPRALREQASAPATGSVRSTARQEIASAAPAGQATASSAPVLASGAPEASARQVRDELQGARTLEAVVPEPWWRGALAGWSLAGLACVLLFTLGLRRLRRDLAGRVELAEGAVVEEVERLRLRAGVARAVRVWVAPRLAAPLSMGWVRPAICVPPRALEELEPEERTAMLAHEVAHLARRDPAWLFVLWLFETALFFQPLNRLARRELAAAFELSADSWAARATGDRLALASSLARIAGWIVGQPPPRAHRAWTAAMADALDGRRPRSRLGERIERLLDARALSEPLRPRRIESALGLALLAALVLLAPGAAAARGAPPPAPADAAPAPQGTQAYPTDAAASSLAGLDEELARLGAELEALRVELDAAGLGQRFDAVLRELERRIGRMAERRGRIAELLERARALEAATTSIPTSTPWQDASLPWTKGTSR
jgi:Zn-dependent protease with chaperone function